MHTKKELDAKFIASGIKPLKKLGQNFLVNAQICQKIVDAVLHSRQTAPWSSIVEIGPGFGALTESLVACRASLILVELDSGLVEYWKKSPHGESLRVIHQDALKLDWSTLEIKRPAILVSNLPYSIAASIVMEMSQVDVFDEMVLMFQKEVAERIQAGVGEEDYGMLSVVAQTFWQIERVVDAGPQDFHPVPNVGSRVLKFVRKETDLNCQHFTEFVKLAFSQRRKKLTKNLEKKYQAVNLEEEVKRLQLKPEARAQELSADAFIKLFESVVRGNVFSRKL